LTIDILTWHILGILASQIKTECIFSIVGILTTLCRCWTKNLDEIILVNKNWPSNPWTHYMKPIDFSFACEMESNLMIELKTKFQDEVDCKDFLDLNETFWSFSSLCKRLVIDGLVHVVLVVENDELNHLSRFRILSKFIHDSTLWRGWQFLGIFFGCLFFILFLSPTWVLCLKSKVSYMFVFCGGLFHLSFTSLYVICSLCF
jgi:hypothetical protein